MFWRILKRDLKRKKTMNCIVLFFVILAAVFVASGLNNVITVANGTDYYLDKAGIGDYNVVTNTSTDDSLERVLDATKEVDSYRIEETVFAAEHTLFNSAGEEIGNDGPIKLVQNYDACVVRFFDENNSIPETPKAGHCYVTADFLKKNKLQPGDEIRIKIGEAEFSVIADKNIKDAFLGSGFLGNSRILLNASDYEKLSVRDEIRNKYSGKICYIDTKDVQTVEAAVTKAGNNFFAGGRSLIKMTYVMSLIVAFIVLTLSICLIIVSFAILKFAINFTIMEDYREIGVMKAIGIRNFKIRLIYFTKYFILAIAGSFIGFLLSIPFGNMLIRSSSQKMVLGNDLGILPNIMGALLVVIFILLFSYKSTQRVKKATPVDAIRSGQTGERYTKKSLLHLSKSKAGAPFFMALNDVFSGFKRYLTITIGFALCALFVLILVNTVSTMKSEKLINTFASKSDLYYSADFMPYMHEGGGEELGAYMKQVENELAELGMPGDVFMDVQYFYPISCKGKEYSIKLQQGVNTSMDMYRFSKGTAPQSKYEIAITPIVAKKMDAHIGDTVTIDYGTEKIDCVVTAYFESMNLMGEIIRIHEDAPTNMVDASSAMAYQISFKDNPSQKQLKARKTKLTECLRCDEMFTAKEYQIDCLGVVDTMDMVKKLLLGICIVVVIFITVLTERAFISDERSEIAILKAMGFRDGRVILYHVIRFGIVSAVATLFAGVLSVPMTKLCISPIFGLMGTSQIDFLIEPVNVFLVYPGIFLGVTVFTSYIVALYTKHIKSSDTASIE